MQTHIARALFYPFESGYRRAIGDKSLDLCNQLNFTLEPVDYKRFDLLKLAREVSFSTKLSMAYNMFNELAASKFFNGDLQFAAIAPYVRSNIEALKQKLSTADLKSSFKSLEEVFEFYNTLGTFQS
jgi:1-deoxy-D-xylulose 5-phosphate reductoisomerase